MLEQIKLLRGINRRQVEGNAKKNVPRLTQALWHEPHAEPRVAQWRGVLLGEKIYVGEKVVQIVGRKSRAKEDAGNPPGIVRTP